MQLRRVASLLAAIGLVIAPPAAGRAAAFSLTPDTYEIAEDNSLQVEAASGVLANDVLDGGPALCVVTHGYQTSGHGNMDVDSDGAFVFQPDANFNGTAEWNYSAKPCDSPDEALMTTITITVTPVNDAPSAAADSFAALQNTTLNIAAPGILVNDHDIDAGNTLTAILDTTTVHGVLTLAANGSFSYTPQTGYVGPDSFSYHAFDGTAASPPRVVTLNVGAIATPKPTAPPTPPPTAPPTPAPTVAPTEAPSPSPSIDASPSLAPTPTAFASAGPSADAPTVAPSASAAPEPSDSGGVSTPVLVVAVLFLFLLAFGLSVFVPRWLRSQRTGKPMDGD
jgi:hypothetical protein